mmetsp:Transcript_144696/g.463654  ORF Transcript_144696/g.463654 Transcript_144696/m.463654 type:complete len:207 (-) Transcript_144696:990-1610(-)
MTSSTGSMRRMSDLPPGSPSTRPSGASTPCVHFFAPEGKEPKVRTPSVAGSIRRTSIAPCGMPNTVPSPARTAPLHLPVAKPKSGPMSWAVALRTSTFKTRPWPWGTAYTTLIPGMATAPRHLPATAPRRPEPKVETEPEAASMRRSSVASLGMPSTFLPTATASHHLLLPKALKSRPAKLTVPVATSIRSTLEWSNGMPHTEPSA